MKGTRYRQAGSGAIEVLLIVFVIAALAAIGLFVYQQHTPTAPTNVCQTTNQQKSSTTTQARTDPYADWQTYNDTGYAVASGIRACLTNRAVCATLVPEALGKRVASWLDAAS